MTTLLEELLYNEHGTNLQEDIQNDFKDWTTFPPTVFLERFGRLIDGLARVQEQSTDMIVRLSADQQTPSIVSMMMELETLGLMTLILRGFRDTIDTADETERTLLPITADWIQEKIWAVESRTVELRQEIFARFAVTKADSVEQV